jgi:hypothetical protein
MVAFCQDFTGDAIAKMGQLRELIWNRLTGKHPAEDVALEQAKAGDQSGIDLVSKSGLIEKQSRSKMARVIFHLRNMPSFLRLQKKLHLQAGDWQIVISPVNNIQEQVKQLKKLGGYAVTYVGEIKRSDNKLFKVGEVNELLTCLYYFFSFIMGSWVAPLLPIGYDDHDSIVWEQWGDRRTDSWLNFESWLDLFHHDSISALLLGFWRKWNVEVWQKAITSSIYWYV